MQVPDPSINASAALEELYQELSQPRSTLRVSGRITGIGATGIIVEGLSHAASLEDFVEVASKSGPALAEVVQINAEYLIIRPFDLGQQFYLGERVNILGKPRFFPTEAWKGRIVNAICEPLDGKGPLPQGLHGITYTAKVMNALQRQPIESGLRTGVKVVDLFTPLCFGQRIGIFAGSGVGKSTLLGMLAKASAFDCVVVGLVGERGREVNEFIHGVLQAALQKSVVIIATGDETAPMRKRAALLATSIAEWFRDSGQNVLLLMDSVTRFAQALRDIALAAGEPPVSRGFPPSVFGALPQVLERAGPGPIGAGSITGIYSVLVDGDNHNEPVADAVRGILDGHIVLDRRVGSAGRFPAVDILHSISRLSSKALSTEQAALASQARSLAARYEETKDLRSLGGYTPGKDLERARAVTLVPQLYNYLRQKPSDAAGGDPFQDIAGLLGIRSGETRSPSPRPN